MVKPDVTLAGVIPPRRGPGRPRKIPLDAQPEAPTAAVGDPDELRILDSFSRYRSVAAISRGLHIPAAKIRTVLLSIPIDRIEAWKELNRLRREVDSRGE